MAAKVTEAKLRRWIDLLATLLRHRAGVTMAQLREEVPAYRKDNLDSVNRQIERDKDELRNAGFPIQTIPPNDADEPQRYRIDPRALYLPYVALMAAQGHAQNAPKLREGYRSLSTLAFEPDELNAIISGAALVEGLNDPSLTSDVRSAVRKLTYDLGAAVGGDRSSNGAPRELTTTTRVATLGDALFRRKHVQFTYLSMSSGTRTERAVEPYGLFFTSGHWYLAGRERASGEIRNFRVSRIDNLRPNTKEPRSTDYEIPGTFRLSDHSAAREPWELGDDDAATEMVVEFIGSSGPTIAAERLGCPSTVGQRHRAFDVRRGDAFVRWIMSFAGEVRPVSPDALVADYAAAVAATRMIYEEARRA